MKNPKNEEHYCKLFRNTEMTFYRFDNLFTDTADSGSVLFADLKYHHFKEMTAAKHLTTLPT